MNYLQLKKRAFMKVVNSIKGVVRTASGIPPLTLEGCVDDNSLINYTIHGNSIQNGTPTPETPVEIESVGEYDEVSGKYKIPVVTRGKNLISFPYASSNGHVSNGITYTVNDDGSVTAKGTATGTSSFYFVMNKANVLKSNVYYTMSGCKGGNTTNAYFLQIQRASDSKNFRVTNTPVSFYFDEQLDTTTVSVSVVFRKGYVADNVTFYPMIEEGEVTTTEYEPYVEPVTTNIYLSEPLQSGEIISYPEMAELPQLPTFKGTTVYEVDTTTQPSLMRVDYYSNVKGD